MPTHRRKIVEVEARQVTGSITVVHDSKGEQQAKKGDWLVGSERGLVEVFKRHDFEREFEPIPEPSLHGLADAPEVDAAVASTGDYAGISRDTTKE